MAEQRAELLVWLANLGVPRRPGPSTPPDTPPVDVAGAGLDRLGDIARSVADDLIAGRAPDGVALATLNDLASGTARSRLAWRDGRLSHELDWHDPDPTAAAARRLIGELATIEPSRLRRCAREECGLVFYDGTRSATRRWHADNPCGWRERQARRRRPGQQ